MKIVSIDITHVAVNKVRGNWTFVQVRTDEGITGLGEATHVYAPEGSERALRAIEPHIVGRDPLNIEALMQTFLGADKSGGPQYITALSGIETALWDIKGKVLGAPVHSLLGGKIRDRLRLYANLNRKQGLKVSPQGFASAALEAVQAGFTAVKFYPFYGYMDGTNVVAGKLKDSVRDEGLARVAAVREAWGPEVDILLQMPPYDMDIEQMMALAEAFETYRPYWYQGTWARTQDQVTFARSTSIPVTSPARGPMTASRSQWGEMLCAGAMSITNPDLMSVGGLWEMKKIASMVEAFGVRFSPHSPYGPVHTVADGHLCATVANFDILEYSVAEAPWRGQVTRPGEHIQDGYLVVSDAPGLGIELDEAIAALHPLGPHPSPGGLDAVWGTRSTKK